MADGSSNDGIAKRLHLSVKSVESISRAVFQKLGLTDESHDQNRRVKAVLVYLEHTVAEDGPVPVPATTFVGRSHLVASVRSHLEQSRCVTLTGLGGIGKTRLAIEVARCHVAEIGPVRFVDLVAATTDGAVSTAFVHAFGAAGADRLERAIAKAAGDRRLLVVIDNAEEVIERIGTWITKLLRHPELSVLVTSRVPIGQRYELVVPVPALSPTEAVRLLHVRLRTEVDHEEAVLLCEAVGRMPLAVEMLAARLRNVSAPDLVDRIGKLDDLIDESAPDHRHGTLAGVFTSTMNSLPPDVARALRLLSGVPGGFQLDTAAAIVGGANIVGTVALLADVSLLDFDGVRRYRMLEPIRQMAVQQLQATGDEPLFRSRLVEWCVDLATDQLAAAQVPDDKTTQAAERPSHRRLMADRLAIEAALRTALDDGLYRSALQIIGAFGPWMATSHPKSWVSLVEKALAQVDPADDPATVGAAEFTAGLLMASAQDDRCEVFLRRAEEHFSEAGDQASALQAQYWLLRYNGGNEALFARAIALAEQLGDVRLQALMWGGRAHHGFLAGLPLETVEPWALTAVSLGRRASRSAAVMALQFLAFRWLDTNRPLDEVVALVEEAEQLLSKMKSVGMLSEVAVLRARIFLRSGEVDAARAMFVAAFAGTEPSDNMTHPVFISLYAFDALVGAVDVGVLADLRSPIVWFLNQRWGKPHPSLVAKDPQLAFTPVPESGLEHVIAATTEVHRLLRELLPGEPTRTV
jgi:predicted ATPase